MFMCVRYTLLTLPSPPEGYPEYVVMNNFTPNQRLKGRGGQISTFIPSIQIFDFYPIGRLPHSYFFFKIESKVNACYLRFSVR
jgi:hypothetical protein